jgi:RNase P/RNase MRP subunit p29
MIRKFLLLSLLFSLFGCNKSNEQINNEIELLSVDHSNCKGNKSAVIEESDEMLIVRSAGDKIYTIQHQNVIFNCCLPEGLAVEVAIKNDTIFYTEKEKVTGTCKCLCTYDLTGEIGNLEAGEYVLCLIKETDKLGTITLNFKNNMNEEILVSELKDYPYL